MCVYIYIYIERERERERERGREREREIYTAYLSILSNGSTDCRRCVRKRRGVRSAYGSGAKKHAEAEGLLREQRTPRCSGVRTTDVPSIQVGNEEGREEGLDGRKQRTKRVESQKGEARGRGGGARVELLSLSLSLLSLSL